MASVALNNGEWARGWRTLLAASIAVSTGAAAFTYTAGLFVKPIEATMGWNRAEIATGATLNHLAVALMMPVIGYLVDRFGSRRVGIAGLAGFGLLLLSLSRIPPVLTAYYAVLVLIGVFASAASAVVFAPVVVAYFRKWRGVALGLMMSGTAVLLIPLSPMLQEVILQHGWRQGYVMLGCAALLVGLPLVLFLLGREQAPRAAARDSGHVSGMVFPEILRTATYWKLILGTCAAAIPLGGFLNQMPALLSDKGIEPVSVALLVSVFLGTIAIGRTATGLLFDLLSPPRVALLILCGAAISSLVLLRSDLTFLMCIPLVALIGFAMGAEAEFHAYFAVRQFGQTAFATTFGTLVMCTSASLGTGALVFGTIYHHVGNYAPALIMAMCSFVLSGLMFGTMPRPYGEGMAHGARRS